MYRLNQPIQGVPHSTIPLPRHVEYAESNLRTRDTTSVHTVTSNTCDVDNHSRLPLPRQQSNDELTITFFELDEPIHMRAGRLVAVGPLSLGAVIRSDPYVRMTLLKARRERNENQGPTANRLDKKELVKQILLDKGNKNPTVEEAFQTRLLENETLDEVKGATQRVDTQLFGTTRADYEADTIDRIEKALPTQRLMWLLVDKFFKGSISVFMPFLTEVFFRERIQELLGARSDECVRFPKIKITRRFDFAYVGMLFLIMRLTFLGISKTDHNTEEEQYILDNPIGPHATNIAQMCLNQFRLLRRGAIPVIQCSLLMRMYHKYAPEEGDGSVGGDSEVFLGMLLQMANSIGMNRDLSQSPQLAKFHKLKNIWRFIWHEIVSLDLDQALMKGNPLLVDENSFDTMLPSLKHEESNFQDYQLLECAVNNFQITDEINQMVRNFLRDILNIKRPVRVSELLLKTSKLEIYLDTNFQSLEAVLNLPIGSVSQSTVKIHKFKHYVELKTSLYMIYFQIFCKSPTVNYPLLHKMFSICLEMVPLSYMLLTINNGRTNYFEEIFGPNAQLILVPSIFAPLHKLSNLLVAFILRALDSKYNHPPSEKAQIISGILEKLMDHYSLVRDGFASLSSFYYHAWRNCKNFDFLYDLLKDDSNSIMDKNAPVNKDTATLPDEINHFKIFPERNELYEMTQWQLTQLSELITSKGFEDPILKKLNTSSKYKTRGSGGIRVKAAKESLHKRQQLVPDSGGTPDEIQKQPADGMTTAPLAQDSSNGMHSHTQMSLTDSSSTPTTTSASACSNSPSQRFHVNPNVMTNAEIDMLWLQMMATNTDGDEQVAAVMNDVPDVPTAEACDIPLQFDLPYDIFGDISSYYESI